MMIVLTNILVSFACNFGTCDFEEAPEVSQASIIQRVEPGLADSAKITIKE